jgi:glycosyltransferase involved in cell wall biosynthesis
MKVALSSASVFPFHRYGGLEKYVYCLSKYLIENGIDVEVVTSLDRGKKRMEIYENIKYTFIPPMLSRRRFNGPGSNLFHVNVAKYIKKNNFDTFHSYGSTSYTYLHFKNRIPTIVQLFLETFVDPFYVEMKYIKKLYLDIFYKHQYKYCMTHADAIASEGDFQTPEIIKIFGVNKEKIFNLPVGVDISLIKERLEVKKLSRKDLGLTDDDFVLISVNRIVPGKGIDYLIDGFSVIKQNISNAKLILIGTGFEEEKIINQINSYKLTDSIIHLKNVPEEFLYNYYDLSNIYISPTTQDDFIMGILEAMVCGLPIVSTGQRFLVQSRVNGYVILKRDPQAIADAVLNIYGKDECRKMGDMSQQIAKKFDMAIIAKMAIKEYEKLIEKC